MGATMNIRAHGFLGYLARRRGEHERARILANVRYWPKSDAG